MSKFAQLTIPAPCGWVNSNHRRHRMAEAKDVKAWRETARDAVLALGWEPFTGRVHIVAHIWKSRAGRYDPNNLWPTVKAVVDGLVEAGFLVDDDHKHVLGPDMRHGGKGEAALVLEIRPVP